MNADDINTPGTSAQREYERRLETVAPGGQVVFMAGGGGAGKSSAETLLAPLLEQAHTVYDGTLSSYDKAERNIQMALDAGQRVTIAYVYREPEEAFRNGVLTRAMRAGRTVPIDALVKGHAGDRQIHPGQILAVSPPQERRCPAKGIFKGQPPPVGAGKGRVHLMAGIFQCHVVSPSCFDPMGCALRPGSASDQGLTGRAGQAKRPKQVKWREDGWIGFGVEVTGHPLVSEAREPADDMMLEAV